MTKDKIISCVADECRAIYIRERQLFQMMMNGDERQYIPNKKWDGNDFPDSYDEKSVWPKIASFTIEHQFDPAVCIWARFQHQKSMNNRRPPMPNQIALDKYVDMYKVAIEQSSEAIKQQLEFDREYLKKELRILRLDDAELSSKEACELVLLDETIPVSPLFRYCLAHQEGLDKVKEWFFDAACSQYRRFPNQYVAYWEEAKIPKSISGKVKADRALVIEDEVTCNG